VRFFAYRFLVFNKELDEEPEFSHDHEIIERHPHPHPSAAVENVPAVRDPAVRDPAVRARAVQDPERPGPPA
jgi:hypothetical protein